MMDDLTLGQHLAYVRELVDENLVADTPSECLALWERGQAAGFRLGRLYALRRPLGAGVGGEYDPRSGDIWIVHDPARPERASRYLLHELAHAQRPPLGPAASIDAYCDEELATEKRARTLAAVWGVPHLLTEEAVEAFRAETDELRADLVAAGVLAGSLHPALARRAYAALWSLASREGRTREVFRDALNGVADDPAANTRALDFDRSALRGRWSVGWGRGGDFGPLMLAQDEAGAALLRSALEHAVGDHGDAGAAFVARGGDGATRYRFGFLRLEIADDLPRVLAAANHALLAHERRYALATWDCFGDAAGLATERLYRLWVRYPDADRRDEPEPPDAQLWVLAMPRRAHDLRTEAALQQFILGWTERIRLGTDRWRTGLEEFAEYEQTAR